MTAALAGAGVIAALGVVHGDVELWRIRLAGGVVILPAAGSRPGALVDIHAGDIDVGDIVRFIADSTGRAIIVEADLRQCLRSTITMATRMDDVTAAIAMQILEANRFAFAERFGRCFYLLKSEAFCTLDQPVERSLYIVAPAAAPTGP